LALGNTPSWRANWSHPGSLSPRDGTPHGHHLVDQRPRGMPVQWRRIHPWPAPSTPPVGACGLISMRAMQLLAPRTPLVAAVVRDPILGRGEVLLKVRVCGLCRTDLHIVDGELAVPRLPLIPGHQVVGEVAGLGPDSGRYRVGERVGVPWLGWTCGECEYLPRTSSPRSPPRWRSMNSPKLTRPWLASVRGLSWAPRCYRWHS